MVREEICDNVAIARHHQGNTGKPATHNQKHLLTLELSKETGVVKRFTSGKFVLELKILAGSLYSVRATLIISGVQIRPGLSSEQKRKRRGLQMKSISGPGQSAARDERSESERF
jgi:hypothetical protein